MNNKTVSRLALSIAAMSIVAYACGGGDTGIQNDITGGNGGSIATGGGIPQAATGGASAGTGTGGATGGTGGSIIGTGGLIQTVGGSAGMPMVEEDTACGTGMAMADLRPVNMFVIYDRSYSMLECGDGSGSGMMGGCDTGPTRWDMTSAALIQFFQSAEAADLGVALRFYPHNLPVEGCTSDGFNNPALDAGTTMGCDINACAMPLVDMGVLTADPAPTDAHEQALVTAVQGAAPLVSGEGTPTFVALSGAAQWAVAYQQAHPEQRTVIVLVTDGEPNGCNTQTQAIAGVAADALAAAEVSTYAIGLALSGSQDFMNAIAMAGGTDQAFFVSDGATATADLVAAFNAIRGMALACDFAVPSSTAAGMAIDPNLINVNFSTTAGGEVQLGLVGSAAECGTQQAWYYDNPAMPTRIMLCPASCETVTGDANASIAILAGCKPRVPVTK